MEHTYLFAILVLVGFVSVIAYGIGERVIEWVRRGRVSIIDQPEIDHAVCEGDDCDQVLCYCTGVLAACPGTVDPGCLHIGATVCQGHRLSDCSRCLEDYAADRSLQLAQDMWRGLL